MLPSDASRVAMADPIAPAPPVTIATRFGEFVVKSVIPLLVQAVVRRTCCMRVAIPATWAGGHISGPEPLKTRMERDGCRWCYICVVVHDDMRRLWIGAKMELRQLRYAVALAEYRHFGRAAEAAGIRQPPLSQQIQKLEEEVGVRLFRRSRQGTELTPAGEVFVSHARRALRAAESARAEAARVERGEVGSLVIGYLPSAVDMFLPGVFRVFRRRWRRIGLQPVEFTLTAEGVQAVRRGDVDCTFGRPVLPEASGEDDLAALQLFDDCINVVLPRSHPLAHRSDIRPYELRRQPFLLTPLEERFPRYWNMICQAAGFEPIIGSRVRGSHTVMGMVSAGLGVGILPESARAYARTDVVFKPLNPQIVAPPLTLIWRRNVEQGPLANFMETVRMTLHISNEVSTGHDLNRNYVETLRADVGRI